MLVLDVPIAESYDEAKNEFVVASSHRLVLEHSLASLSKWESITEKPFLGPKDKTEEELVAYIKVMNVGPDLPDEVFHHLTQEHILKINEYVNGRMTATTFHDNSKPNREIITAEIIYHWMIEAGVPLEWENRHLNQLFALLRTRSAKSQQPKKMSRAEIAQRNRELNARRRAELNSKG